MTGIGVILGNPSYQLRNGARELRGIALTVGDIMPLAAFLRSLNEDYQ